MTKPATTTVTAKELTTGDVIKHRMPTTITATVGRITTSSTGRTLYVDLWTPEGHADGTSRLIHTAWLGVDTKVTKLDACWHCTDGRECGICGRNVPEAV